MNFFRTKIKKLLVGKYYGNFKNLFRGTGLDIKDFKQYEIGDDTRHINWKLSTKYDKIFLNVLGEQKDVDIDLFIDINQNFLGGVNKKNIDMIFDFIKDLFLYCKRYGANLKGFYVENNKLKLIKVSDETSLYKILINTQRLVDLSGDSYKTNLDVFLRSQKKIGKRHMIMMISDFLELGQDNVSNIKALDLKNEVFLLKLDVNVSIGKNFDYFDLLSDKSKVNGLKFISLN